MKAPAAAHPMKARAMAPKWIAMSPVLPIESVDTLEFPPVEVLPLMGVTFWFPFWFLLPFCGSGSGFGSAFFKVTVASASTILELEAIAVAVL